jgi:HK97 family phage portal protein
MTVLSRLASRAVTPQQLFSTDLDWGMGNTSAGVNVTHDTAKKLAAVWACQRLLTNSVSTMPVKVLRRVGDRRLVVDDPSWLVSPTTNPNDTEIDHFADVTMSLLGDGNSFTRAMASVFMAEYLYVLDAPKVKIKQAPEVLYTLTSVGEFTPLELIHISLLRKPGQLRGLSPIDYALDTVGIGLAAQEFGARFFANGATLSGVIQSPNAMPDTAIKNLKESFANAHSGVKNSHAIGVLTNGATFKEMTSTPAQSQLLELRKFTVEDIARIYGIPPHMIGSQEPGAVAYASIEQRAIEYVQTGVQPLVAKIERAYRRLLPPDQYLKFNLAALLRGDLKSRYEAYQIALNGKFMTRDEVRAFEDMEPADDAKGVTSPNGGYLETPNNNAPDQPAPRSASESFSVVLPEVRVESEAIEHLSSTVNESLEPIGAHVAAAVKDELGNQAKLIREGNEANARLLAEVAATIRAPRKRLVERDAQGVITGVIDYASPNTEG